MSWSSIQQQGAADHSTGKHYKLVCRSCGHIMEDDGYRLVCSMQHEPAFLITRYARKQFTVDDQAPGLFRYHEWLPMEYEASDLHIASGPVTYRSQRLARALGLSQLWITFNGYWPEKQALLETATFKELEAYTVLSRMRHLRDAILVVSSAGNTAAAFAQVCSRHQVPCLLLMPESGLESMKFSQPLSSCVSIVALRGADYADAISLASSVARQSGFVAEGGAMNIARRDGLGTVLLNAVEAIGRLPEYYFQAIGSGSGAIAVHEAAERLVQDGRFGQQYPRLMLSQNLPFAPVYLAWQAKMKTLPSLTRQEGKSQIQQITAHVLSNQHPPYALPGGLVDVLTESQGEMLAATNEETLAAMQLFEELEGIDINPASGVALATLLKASQADQLDKNTCILLNITGGGWLRRLREQPLIPARPLLLIDEKDMFTAATLEKIIVAATTKPDIRV